MNILLTDLLRCPRCGPEFGLVLLGDRIEERRVLQGRLGCPNCREKYPVSEGFLDLRSPPRKPLAPRAGRGAPDDREEAIRIAALLGVGEGPGYLVLDERTARMAPAISELIDGVEVVALGSEVAGWKESHGVSRMAVGSSLPFAPRRMRGIFLDVALADGGFDEDAFDETRLESSFRAVGPGSRVVLRASDGGNREAAEAGPSEAAGEHASEGVRESALERARERAREMELNVILDEDGVLVVGR